MSGRLPDAASVGAAERTALLMLGGAGCDDWHNDDFRELLLRKDHTGGHIALHKLHAQGALDSHDFAAFGAETEGVLD